MTRDEFLEHAGHEIDAALGNRKNRMLNLVEQAWAEGKRNAEVDTLKEAVLQAFTKGVATIDKPCEVTKEAHIQHDDDDCVLIFRGKEYKCKLGQTCVLQDEYGMVTKRKFEIYEV